MARPSASARRRTDSRFTQSTRFKYCVTSRRGADRGVAPHFIPTDRDDPLIDRDIAAWCRTDNVELKGEWPTPWGAYEGAANPQ